MLLANISTPRQKKHNCVHGKPKLHPICKTEWAHYSKWKYGGILNGEIPSAEAP